MEIEKTKTEAEAIAAMLATLEETIAKLEACETEGSILAWPAYGLGVKFLGGGKTLAVGLWAACVAATENMPEEAYAWVPNVRNGKGEQAVLVNAKAACAKEAVKVRALLAEFKAKIAA